MNWKEHIHLSSAIQELPAWKTGLAMVSGYPLVSSVRQLGKLVKFGELDVDEYLKAKTEGPVILYTWHQNSFLCFWLLCRLPQFSDLLLIGHDQFKALFFAVPSAMFGINLFLFSRQSSQNATLQIQEGVRKENPFLIYPDSAGPYLKLKPGIIRIAHATGAKLLPLAVDVSKKFFYGKTLRHVVPLPGSTLRCNVGKPVALIPKDEPNSEIRNVALCEKALVDAFKKFP